ncbi:MAG TPA: hypothetical protein VNW92_07520, partial [Polyangiaceae bacterium]|nr:hypothetical protein [Polyangiaceae bacterium]
MRVWVAFLGGAVLAGALFAAYPYVHDWEYSELAVLVGGQVPPRQDSLENWLDQRGAGVARRRAV